VILVDDRAGSREFLPLLGGEVVSFHGEGSTADAIIPGNGPCGEVLVGVEIKTLADLLASMATGRLAGTQVRALFEAEYDYIWLLIIGRHRPGVNRRLEVFKYVKHGREFWFPCRAGNRDLPYAYVESMITELATMGIFTRQVEDTRAGATWLLAQAAWWGKPWDGHRAMRKFDRSRERAMVPGMNGDPRKEQDAKIYSQIPGFGWERAWAVAERFTSVMEAGTATAQEWASIPRIGPVLAKVALEALNGYKHVRT